MRRIDGNSKVAVKAALAVALIMASGRAAAQTTNATDGAPKRQVIVSLTDRKLALLEDGRLLKVYPVAIGAKNTPSPTGSFAIVNRLTNPTYYGNGKVVAPGAQNPLGTRWMGLSAKGYGIHGTNAPKSIGRAASHGCIRMAKADLEELFEMLRVGDGVEIRAGNDEQTARLFGAEQVVVAQATPANGATEQWTWVAGN